MGVPRIALVIDEIIWPYWLWHPWRRGPCISDCRDADVPSKYAREIPPPDAKDDEEESSDAQGPEQALLVRDAEVLVVFRPSIQEPIIVVGARPARERLLRA